MRRLFNSTCLLTLLLAACASSPPVLLSEGTVLLVEVRHVLTRALVEAGEIAPGDRRDKFAQSLYSAGFTDVQIDAGRVLVVRDYIYWNNTASGIKRSHLGLTLAEGEPRPQPGQIVELVTRQAVPSVVQRVRANSLAGGGCHYAEIENSVAKELMGALSMVGPSGVASLYCAGIEREGWQRPRTLWHKLPGASVSTSVAAGAGAVAPGRTVSPGSDAAPAPIIASRADLAMVILYRQRALAKSIFDLPVWIDGQKLAQLENGTCDVVLIPPGDHVLTAGTGERFGLARREVKLSVKAGERVVAVYATDQERWNRLGVETLFKPHEEYEADIFSLTLRPARPDDSCTLRHAPTVMSPVPPPR